MSEDFKRHFSLKFFFTLIVMKLKFDHIGQVFAIKTTDDHQLSGFIVWRTWLSVKKKKKFMTIHQIVVWWIAGSLHLHLMVFLSQRPSLNREKVIDSSLYACITCYHVTELPIKNEETPSVEEDHEMWLKALEKSSKWTLN